MPCSADSDNILVAQGDSSASGLTETRSERAAQVLEAKHGAKPDWARQEALEVSTAECKDQSHLQQAWGGMPQAAHAGRNTGPPCAAQAAGDAAAV